MGLLAVLSGSSFLQAVILGILSIMSGVTNGLVTNQW